MRIKNNNITLTRGETATIKYVGVKKNGQPYILTPADLSKPLTERYDYAIAAFTVKTSTYGEVVLVKYLDLEAPPMYDGATDKTNGGFHKFSKQEVVPVSQISSITQFNVVYEYTDPTTGVVSYYTAFNNPANTLKPFVKQYRFAFSIPIDWQDLESLEAKEYVYDLTLYYGQLTAEELEQRANALAAVNDDFPLYNDRNLVKVPLITPHKFILEDSNNV